MQSTARGQPQHVAMIIDGNGRWAQERGLPRSAGHRAGSVAVRRTVEHAVALGIPELTLFAFSSDNWARPADEVDALMRLFARYLRLELPRCIRHGVRLEVIGRRDRLPPRLVEAIEFAERRTARGEKLWLRLAVDYSGRDSLLRAARALSDAGADFECFLAELARCLHARHPIPDVDLLIRTGGEHRLSDFLLLECAYAELYFTPVLWPDFGAAHLDAALAAFAARERRFGRLPQRAPDRKEAIQ